MEQNPHDHIGHYVLNQTLSHHFFQAGKPRLSFKTKTRTNQKAHHNVHSKVKCKANETIKTKNSSRDANPDGAEASCISQTSQVLLHDSLVVDVKELFFQLRILFLLKSVFDGCRFLAWGELGLPDEFVNLF